METSAFRWIARGKAGVLMNNDAQRMLPGGNNHMKIAKRVPSLSHVPLAGFARPQCALSGERGW